MENYIVSARKYRPVTFDTVVGQSALTTTLKNAVKSGKLAHAYLFCGPRGVGKTTCARIFARTINCLSPRENGEACGVCESCKSFDEQRSYNIHELDAASNNSVDDIRQLIEQVRIPPQIGKYKVFIIDEVHMLSQAAFNAFLKTLEEPPRHAIFVLATTEKHKILPTILSRCQVYDFKRMGVGDIVAHLKNVVEQESMKAEEAALNVIAQKADGGMRDALSIFDQVASFCGGDITYQRTIENLNVLDNEYYFQLTDSFLKGDTTACILTFNEVLSKGFEGQSFIAGLAAHFRNLLVSKDVQTLPLIDAGEEVRAHYMEQAQRCSAKFLFRAMKLANTCDLNYKQSQNKRLLVELTLIETAQLSGDDEAASGLGPTKTLNPIFDRLDKPAAQTEAQTVTQTTQPDPQPQPNAQATLPPHVDMPKAAPPPSPQVPADTIANQSPTVLTKPRSFSIRKKVREENDVQQEQTLVQEAQPQYEANMNKAVDAMELVVAWREFAANLPREDTAMSRQMNNMEPALAPDGQAFLIIADNPSVQSALDKMRPRIETYLHQRLHNNTLRMETRLREATDRRRVFSRAEQWQNMLKDSEALRKLKEEFSLELI